MTSDTIKLAYMAGLLDGEGSIHTSTRKHGWTPMLSVSVQMTDQRAIAWIAEEFGGKTYAVRRKKPPTLPNGKQPKSYRPQFMWRVQARAAGEFLSAVLPYLIVKRQQAELGIAIRALAVPRSTRTRENLALVVGMATNISDLNNGRQPASA